MLQGIAKWFAYLILTAIAILVILSLTGQMGVVRELKEHIVIAKKAGIPNISIMEVIRLHRRFTGLLIVSFFGFILVCAGLLTVMQHSRDAYQFSEIQDKVRYSLKKTSPGVMMLILGALALAISNYGYSYLERRYSNIFSAIQRDRMTHLTKRAYRDTAVVRVDSALLRRIIGPADSLTVIQKNIAQTGDTVIMHEATPQASTSKPLKMQEPVVVTEGKHSTKKEAAKKKDAIVAHAELHAQDKKVAKKEAVVKPLKSVAAITSAKTVVKKDSTSRPVLAKKQDSIPASVPALTTNYPDPVQWAKSLQRRVVMFGYVPTKQDRADYSEIIRVNSGDPAFSGDMRWAYGFVTRLIDGYQPTSEELRRYELVVSHSLAAR